MSCYKNAVEYILDVLHEISLPTFIFFILYLGTKSLFHKISWYFLVRQKVHRAREASPKIQHKSFRVMYKNLTQSTKNLITLPPPHPLKNGRGRLPPSSGAPEYLKKIRNTIFFALEGDCTFTQLSHNCKTEPSPRWNFIKLHHPSVCNFTHG